MIIKLVDFSFKIGSLMTTRTIHVPIAGNEMPNAVDLDGLEPAYTNPRQGLFAGLGQLAEALGGLIDRTASIFTKSSVEVDVPINKSGTSVVATSTSTTTYGTNVGGIIEASKRGARIGDVPVVNAEQKIENKLEISRR